MEEQKEVGSKFGKLFNRINMTWWRGSWVQMPSKKSYYNFLGGFGKNPKK